MSYKIKILICMTNPRINSFQKYMDNNDEINQAISSLRNSFKLGEFDIFTLIKDKIKNYKKLTDAELEFIETLSESQKIELILLYNKIISVLENIL